MMGVLGLLTGLALAAIITCPPISGQMVRQDICSLNATNALNSFAYHCMSGMLAGFAGYYNRFPANFYNLQGWNQTCSSSDNLVSCIDTVKAFEKCSDSQKEVFIREARRYVQNAWRDEGFYMGTGACDGPTYSPRIRQLYQVVTESCRAEVTDTVDVCIEYWSNTKDLYRHVSHVHKNVTRIAVKTYRCTLESLPSRCGPAGEDLAMFLLNLTFPPQTRPSQPPTPTPETINTKPFLSARRSTIGAYGDPHFLVYRNYQLLTCEVSGLRDYLVNDFLRVSAIGTYVNQSATRGTVLTWVSISFFDSKGGVSVSYGAAGGELPPSLVEHSKGGKVADEHEVTMITKDNEVRLRVVSLGITLHIGRWNRYYSLVVRASDDMLRRSSGILIDGCLELDFINVQDVIGRKWRTDQSMKSKCENSCMKVNSSEMYAYKDACLYDCIATGDDKITSMSTSFQKTLSDIRLEDDAFPLLPYEVIGGSSGLLPGYISLTLLACLGSILSMSHLLLS